MGVIKQYCEVGIITEGALFRRIRRGDNITGRRVWNFFLNIPFVDQAIG